MNAYLISKKGIVKPPNGMGKCQLATGNSDELDFVMDCALQLFMSLVRLCIGTSSCTHGLECHRTFYFLWTSSPFCNDVEPL